MPDTMRNAATHEVRAAGGMGGENNSWKTCPYGAGQWPTLCEEWQESQSSFSNFLSYVILGHLLNYFEPLIT